MADGNARIEALTARLAVLERRTMPRIPQTPPRPALEPVDLTWLTGPRGLAIAGGIVTLLGIAFVFVLAASRGWIGPAVRCSVGAGVSALLLVAAVLLRRRFGQVMSALAAAGAGIGGLYVTLYAASRGYHLLGAGIVWAGVVIAAGLVLTLALAWNSQLLETLGLVAVVVAPPAVQGKLTALGLGASLVAAAAALRVGQLRQWRAGAAAYQRRTERLDLFAVALASVSQPGRSKVSRSPRSRYGSGDGASRRPGWPTSPPPSCTCSVSRRRSAISSASARTPPGTLRRCSSWSQLSRLSHSCFEGARRCCLGSIWQPPRPADFSVSTQRPSPSWTSRNGSAVRTCTRNTSAVRPSYPHCGRLAHSRC